MSRVVSVGAVRLSPALIVAIDGASCWQQGHCPSAEETLVLSIRRAGMVPRLMVNRFSPGIEKCHSLFSALVQLTTAARRIVAALICHLL